MPSYRPWFRLYSALRTDPRVRGLTDLQFRAFINLLCLANDSSRQGHIELSPGQPYSDRALADAIQVHPRSLHKTLEKLIEDGVGGLSKADDNTLIMLKWDDSNPLDPTNALRQRAYRSKVAQLPKTVTSALQDRDSDVTVTGESRIEKNKVEKSTPPTPLNPPQGAAVSSQGEDKFQVDEDWQRVRECYETNIAQLTPRVDDLIKATLSEGMAPDWVVDAIYEAVRLNHRSWAYIEAILRRWREEGRSPPTRDKAGKKKKEVSNDRERGEVPDGWTVTESYPGQEDVPEVPGGVSDTFASNKGDRCAT